MSADYICIRIPCTRKAVLGYISKLTCTRKAVFGYIFVLTCTRKAVFAIWREEFQLVSGTNHFTSRSLEFYL